MRRALGLDVGGTSVKLALLDFDEVVQRERIPLPAGGVVEFVRDTAWRALERTGAGSLGVGLAGLVRHPSGEFVWGPHLEGMSVPYRELLSETVGMDVAVDNDANLAAWAEWSIGAGERADPMVMIALGSGIGAGFVLGGRIYRGRSYAGEAGHIEIVADGEECSCGRRGCWETLVSGTLLDKEAARLAARYPNGAVAAAARGEIPSGADLAQAATTGDPAAVAAVGDAGRWLGRGLANLVLLLDPARIVVGGAASSAGGPLLEPAARVLRQAMAGSTVRPQVPIVAARFGAFSGAVGAALAGRQVQNGGHDG